MTEDQFQKLAESGYNRIPIVREILADTETPLSIYLKLGKGPGNEVGTGEHSYFFESVRVARNGVVTPLSDCLALLCCVLWTKL